jgi:hypothetical protein
MTVPIDATTDPSQSVHDEDLQMVVQQAQDQLRQLTLQRQEIAQRITIIKRTINGLALLYGDGLQRRPDDDATAERRYGITNACRMVLAQADKPLSTHEIHAILQEEFPHLLRPSIVTILNRLVKYGEADTFLRNGSRFWQRHPLVDHGPAGSSGP